MARIRKRRKVMSDINVVPYIDVMLVLLIIFMVTAPMMNLSVDIDLPQSKARPRDQEGDPVIISIDKQGQFFITLKKDGARESRTAEALQQDLQAFSGADSKRAVLITADETVPYGLVYQAMAIAQAAKVQRVGFLSRPEK
jgi:biopolymer transport protein TolR